MSGIERLRELLDRGEITRDDLIAIVENEDKRRNYQSTIAYQKFNVVVKKVEPSDIEITDRVV